jgi:DNA-3-methyladenine glycosylase
MEDAASHARFGPTGRNRVMFGPPGRAYVYLVYGMHDCLNVVTEPEGRPAAVLVRAVEPLAGARAMRAARLVHALRRRAVAEHPDARADLERRIEALPEARLASGPGLVTAAFSIGRSETGIDLLDRSSALRLVLPGEPLPTARIGSSARVGVGYAAEPWRSVAWRSYDRTSASVSGRRSSDVPG